MKNKKNANQTGSLNTLYESPSGAWKKNVWKNCKSPAENEWEGKDSEMRRMGRL